MSDFKSLGGSLEDTLKSSNLKNIAADISEIALDRMMTDGILKNLPIVSTLLNIGKTAVSVRDYLFLKKVIGFLTALESISTEEKKEMIDRINDSEDFRIKVGEKLLYIIDRCQDHEKAKKVGRLFEAVIERKLSYKLFLVACNIVENITFEQLDWFVTTDVMKPPNDELAVELMHTGLLSYDTLPTKGKRNEDGTLKYGGGSGSWSELILFVSPIGSKIKVILSNIDKI